MAMMASNGGQGYSISATPSYRTVKYSLKDALKAVLGGQMDWQSVLNQFPEDLLRVLVDQLPDTLGHVFHNPKGFLALKSEKIKIPLTMSNETVRAVFGHFLASIEAMENSKPEKLTLNDALSLVSEGKMDAAHLFGQLSQEMKDSIDRLCRKDYGNTFLSLSNVHQKEALARLAAELNRAEQPEPKGHTLLEAMQLVMSGELGPMQLHPQLPVAVRELLENACQAMHDCPFEGLEEDKQKTMIAMFMAAAQESQKSG